MYKYKYVITIELILKPTNDKIILKRSDILTDLAVNTGLKSIVINELIDLAKNTDLFICEGMYGDDEKRSKALEYHHMLFSEAAKLARAAGTKELWLTHLSPSMSEPEQYIDNARKIFANTVVGLDRMTKRIDFEE